MFTNFPDDLTLLPYEIFIGMYFGQDLRKVRKRSEVFLVRVGMILEGLQIFLDRAGGCQIILGRTFRSLVSLDHIKAMKAFIAFHFNKNN